MVKKDSNDKEPEGKKTQQVPLSLQEREGLGELMARYQDAVATRNRKFTEKSNANVYPTDIMRAGLAALADLKPEELRVLVLKIRNGR